MKLSTIFIIAGMFIISLYCLIDVSYYASQIEVENNLTSVPMVSIPSIDVNQKLNNKSVSYGVYHEPGSSAPGEGTVIIFGHRTLYGSPFYSLDKLKNGSSVFLDWPGIGNVEYTVKRSFVVSASYRISVEQGQKLFLITCTPIGSDKQRLIVETDLKKIAPFQKTSTQDNPKSYYGLLIILGFLLSGLTLTYFYPVEDDKIILLLVTIGLTLFLTLGYVFPIPADFISSQLTSINNIFGI
ncbi:MAG: class E sortase [Methanobacteriaceae archaeon]|nr:class E sortase [Methanobacteriaceae archaeon]MDO9627047.1 class E sortase [Methanobacteriaceae archaeon]